MRIAITGASGFVGKHVLKELLVRKLDVIVVAHTAASIAAASAIGPTVKLDIADSGADPYRAMGSPDVLIHLAWGGLPNYQSRHHIETELPVQYRFLTSCVKSGLRRLVVTGTCFEYGMATGALAETLGARPCTQYGAAKDSLRTVLETLQNDFAFELAWLRLFYLYGEGQSPRSLYSQLTDAIRSGKTAFDMSEGDQIRDFLPISEAARLIVEAALLNGNTGIVNICSGSPVSVHEQVQRWVAASGRAITLNLGRIPYSEFEPMAFWGDRTKLDRLLGKS